MTALLYLHIAVSWLRWSHQQATLKIMTHEADTLRRGY